MNKGLATIFVAIALGAVPVSPAVAQSSGGALGALPNGNYQCELPGDAAGRAGVRQPSRDFEITGASTYSKDGSRGTYLRRGNELRMTSGPMQGQRYAVMGSRLVRMLDSDGTPSRLRCIRR